MTSSTPPSYTTPRGASSQTPKPSASPAAGATQKTPVHSHIDYSSPSSYFTPHGRLASPSALEYANSPKSAALAALYQVERERERELEKNNTLPAVLPSPEDVEKYRDFRLYREGTGSPQARAREREKWEKEREERRIQAQKRPVDPNAVQQPPVYVPTHRRAKTLGDIGSIKTALDFLSLASAQPIPSYSTERHAVEDDSIFEGYSTTDALPPQSPFEEEEGREKEREGTGFGLGEGTYAKARRGSEIVKFESKERIHFEMSEPSGVTPEGLTRALKEKVGAEVVEIEDMSGLSTPQGRRPSPSLLHSCSFYHPL